jgi:hypothetical protein
MAKDVMETAEDRLLRKAIELARDREKNWIDLSLRLAELADLPDHKGKVHDVVSKFVRRSKLSQKTYYRYLKIGRTLRDLPLNRRMRDRLAKIRPTKCEAICATLTAANANELLKKADEKTDLELKAELRGAAYKQKPYRIRFDFNRQHQPRVEQALLHCGAKRNKSNAGLGGKEEAFLELIKRAFRDEPEDLGDVAMRAG